MANEVLIGLGSNLGDRWSHLRGGLAEMARSGLVVDAASSVYETEPREVTNQPNFLNAVVRAAWEGSADACLRELHRIEALAGRTRTASPQPRTLDLDLLLFGDFTSEAPGLILPHPRLHLRRFVLVPLCEIAAGERHPLLGLTFARLLEECPDTGRVIRVGNSRFEPIGPRAVD